MFEFLPDCLPTYLQRFPHQQWFLEHATSRIDIGIEEQKIKPTLRCSSGKKREMILSCFDFADKYFPPLTIGNSKMTEEKI